MCISDVCPGDDPVSRQGPAEAHTPASVTTKV